MATKDASLTLRLASDLKTALEAEAKRQDRSASKLAEIFIREGLAAKPKRSRQ